MIKELIISKKITEVRTGSLKMYLQEVSRLPILTRDEEYSFAMAASQGDEKAIELLITCNLRFVISVAKIYVDSHSHLEDLINEGNEGLIIAARKFDPTRGFKFISYAIWWIRNRILEYKANYSRVIRIPINKLNEIAKYKEQTSKFLNENSRMPSEEDFEMLNWSDEKIQALLRANSLCVSSLDYQIDEDGGTLMDVIPNENIDRTDHLTLSSDAIIRLKAFLGRLSCQEREILEKLYGLNGDVPMTLTEVGTEYEVSRERIRQIRDKAILSLRCRAVMDNINIDFFVGAVSK
jgi:RNA polymerase primary sigma factor